MLVEVTVASTPEAAVVLGFNSENALRHEMVEERRVLAGTHTLRFSAETKPRDWGRLTGFHALVILRSAVEAGLFVPLEPHLRYIDVREEIARGLVDPNRAYRAAALAAVKHVHQDARDLLSVVQRMAETDSDPAIRQQARRVLALMP